MTVKTKHEIKDSLFFCTFTCYKWLPLFQMTDFYSDIYKWFDIMANNDCRITGYVIMPNHIHFMIFIPEKVKNLNTLIANGKRFMAYEIISRLKKKGDLETLAKLEEMVTDKEKEKGQKHRVFMTSFDAEPCFSDKFILQKLEYMHHNPVSGVWILVEDFRMYEHSSAGYYEMDRQGKYKVVHYKDFTG